MCCKCIWCILVVFKQYLKYLGDIYGCLGISGAFKGYLGVSEGSWEQLGNNNGYVKCIWEYLGISGGTWYVFEGI